MTERSSYRAIAQAFEIELAKLPTGAQQNIRDAMKRDESLSWDMFRAGWLAAAPEGFEPGCGCVFCDLHADHQGNPCTEAAAPEGAQGVELWVSPEGLDRLTRESRSSRPTIACTRVWNCEYRSEGATVRLYTTPPQPHDAARDREDAERYRWLCKKREVMLLTAFFGNGCINRTIAEVDAVIDTNRHQDGGEK